MQQFVRISERFTTLGFLSPSCSRFLTVCFLLASPQSLPLNMLLWKMICTLRASYPIYAPAFRDLVWNTSSGRKKPSHAITNYFLHSHYDFLRICRSFVAFVSSMFRFSLARFSSRSAWVTYTTPERRDDSCPTPH